MNIERVDTDRIGNDVVFKYATPEIAEDEPVLEITVSEDDLLDFIQNWEFNETTMDDYSFFLYAFEDVKDAYWDNVLNPDLEMKYQEALARVQSFKAHHVGDYTQKEIEFISRILKLTA